MTQNFKVKLTKEEYDALEETVKGFYTEAGDVYTANLEGAETEEAITALRNAKQHEKDEADKAKKELAVVKKLLGDAKPEDIQKIIADSKRAQEEALKTAGKWEEMKAQMLKEIEDNRIKPLEAEAKKFKDATEKYLIDSEFSAAVGNLKPKKGAAKALLPHIKSKVRLVEVGGELKPQIFDGDTLQVNAKGEPMTFEEYADKNFRQSDVYGVFFEPDDTAGGGSPAFSAPATNGTSKVISRTDQAAISANIEEIATGAVTVR